MSSSSPNSSPSNADLAIPPAPLPPWLSKKLQPNGWELNPLIRRFIYSEMDHAITMIYYDPKERRVRVSVPPGTGESVKKKVCAMLMCKAEEDLTEEDVNQNPHLYFVEAFLEIESVAPADTSVPPWLSSKLHSSGCHLRSDVMGRIFSRMGDGAVLSFQYSKKEQRIRVAVKPGTRETQKREICSMLMDKGEGELTEEEVNGNKHVYFEEVIVEIQ